VAEGDHPGGRVLGALIIVLAALSAAEDLPPEVLLVAHTLQANKKLLDRLPQYTCLETISRSRPSQKGHKPEKLDVIHLDVGVGAHEEIYSWPGATAFSSEDLSTLVGHGLLASGLFQTFAANLFIGDAGIVKAAGTSVINGKKAFHFTYTIPSLRNTWTVNWLGAHGVVGEQGEFWVDGSDLTLLRLDVAAIDIPPNVPLQSLTLIIQYRTILSGSIRVLIPETAALRVLEWNGTLNQEAIDFSHCRAFEAESSLLAATSTTESLTKTIAHYEAQREILPGGLMFSVQLQTPIQAGKTIVGDAVSAVLESPVKPPGREVIPKGAVLTGRIREFESLGDPPNTFVVGLEFDELTWPGHSAAFLAKLFSMQPVPGIELTLSSEHVQKTISGGFQGNRTTVESIVPVAIPGVATIFPQGAGASLPKDFRMDWRTQEVGRR